MDPLDRYVFRHVQGIITSPVESMGRKRLALAWWMSHVTEQRMRHYRVHHHRRRLTIIMTLALVIMLAASRRRRGAQALWYQPVSDDITSWEDIRDSMHPEEFRRNFRFMPADIPKVAYYLRLPAFFRVTVQRYCLRGELALLMLLHRLASPQRLIDTGRLFRRDASHLSPIINELCDYLLDQWGHKLDPGNWDYMHSKRRVFADALGGAMGFGRGGAVRPIGCVDGTFNRGTRPIRGQRQLYTGRKKTHGLLYHAVTTPDGMFVQVCGPFVGRRHDLYALKKSGLMRTMRRSFGRYCLLADKGYMARRNLLVPHKGRPHQLTPEQVHLNRTISRHRVCVEWRFGKTTMNFSGAVHPPRLKVLLSPVGTHFKVAALIQNVHTCCYGSNEATRYGVPPPSLPVYLPE